MRRRRCYASATRRRGEQFRLRADAVALARVCSGDVEGRLVVSCIGDRAPTRAAPPMKVAHLAVAAKRDAVTLDARFGTAATIVEAIGREPGTAHDFAVRTNVEAHLQANSSVQTAEPSGVASRRYTAATAVALAHRHASRRSPAVALATTTTRSDPGPEVVIARTRLMILRGTCYEDTALRSGLAEPLDSYIQLGHPASQDVWPTKVVDQHRPRASRGQPWRTGG